MTTNTKRTKPTLLIAAVAGLAFSATSVLADPPQKKSPNDQKQMMQGEQVVYNIRSFGDVKGWTVENSLNKEVGVIEDFVIDRGTGQIRYVVLEHGSVLGLGGANRLVSPESMIWLTADKKLRINMTEADVERLPKLNTINWSLVDKQNREASEPNRVDPYATQISETKDRQKAAGMITNVDRRTPRDADEFVVVTIRDDRDRSREIVVGPTWYIMSRATAPQRGDRVEFEVVQLRDTNEAMAVATTATFNGQTLQLRDRNGQAEWLKPENTRQAYGAATHPFVRMSQLVGAPVVAGTRDAGEVQSAFIDLHSNSVQFLGIDPNENFLGMADTIRLAPWTIARYTIDEQVRLDATDQMIKNSPEEPDDATELNAASFRAQVFQHYGVKSDQPARQSAQSAWGENNPYDRAIRDGQPATVRGSFIELAKTDKFPMAKEPVTVLVLRSNDGAKKMVHIGPASQYANQFRECKTGDEVTVEYRTVKIDGNTYEIATRVHTDNGVITLWSPALASAK